MYKENPFAIFNEIREKTKGHDTISNRDALGAAEDAKALHVLWMYPDALNVFGSRGDLMALLHYASLMGIPVEMKRINKLTDDIPLEWADIIYFASGDLSCMPDILKALMPHAEGFKNAAEKGKTIVAVSSSGVLLGNEYTNLDGEKISGLGLLDMNLKEREKVHGDDLWVRLSNGMELLGNQIQLVDVELMSEQKPLAEVIYGRGNDGNGAEGAIKGNVLYTGLVGPALVRNPEFTAMLLRNAAQNADVSSCKGEMLLKDEDIRLEKEALDSVREFIENKMQKSK